MRMLAPFAGAALLAGCATDCSRDPSQVGLGCAVSNLATGVYREDDAAIEREIAQTRERALFLEAEAERLAAEAQRLEGERRAVATRLAALNRETAQASRRLADLSAREGADQARLAELRARQRRLADDLLERSRAPASADAAEIARLEAERAVLEAEIVRLLQRA